MYQMSRIVKILVLLIVFIGVSSCKKETNEMYNRTFNGITKNWDLYKYTNTPGGLPISCPGCFLNIKTDGTFTSNSPVIAMASGNWAFNEEITNIILTAPGSPTRTLSIARLDSELKLEDKDDDGELDNYVYYFKQ